MIWLLPLVALLAACGPAEAPPAPGAIPPAAMLVPEVLARGRASSGDRSVVGVGYLIADASGSRLVAAVRFGEGGPRAVAPPAEQIWIEGPAASGAGPEQAEGYAIVAAGGSLEGPGQYGPGSAYPFRIRSPRLTPLSPRETTIAQLLEGEDRGDARLVRVRGDLLATPGAAALVEQLGQGGLPAPGTRQIKLAGTIPPDLLPGQLRRSPAGDIRYGPVQIEGLWRDGALTPLAILAVT